MADPILILHGWGSKARNWAKVKELLESQGQKVFIPDLPGFGDNPPPEAPWSIDDYADWVKDFCEKENLSQFFLLGHSFGGAVAVKFILKNPGRVKKLFLVANSGIRKKTFKKEFLRKISNFWNKLSFLPFYPFFRKVFYKVMVGESDYISIGQGIMRDILLNVLNEDISNYFRQISVPTVIIWGTRDVVRPIKDAYFINREIKNSILITIPKGDHDLERKMPSILAQKVLANL